MLELIDIGKEYKVSSDITVHALSGVNLKFGGNGFVTVVGKSGCGKTTLLNLLGGIDKPTSGQILFSGTDFSNLSAGKLNDFRNFQASFIFQDYNLLSDYSVLGNIKLAVSFQESSQKIVEQKSIEALEKVGLADLKNRKIATLSGGQKQRVAIARALAKDSSLILCDEPTGNLDSSTARQIIELLKDISKERLVVIVTHDEDICAFADRIIRLKDGVVIEDTIKNDNKSRATNMSVPKKYNGITIKQSFAMILNNYKRSAVTSSAVTLLLAAAFALLTVFLSLAQFNAHDSFVYTLKENNQYVIQITKYIDKPISVHNPNKPGEMMTVNRPLISYENVRYEDMTQLKTENPVANFYPSYFFNKNFQDFTGGRIFFDDYNTKAFEAIGFREAVVVNNFNTFYQELAYGNYPKADNEVLIYDYMAHCLIHYNVFDGAISNVVGKELTDFQSGLNMKISGIIKSDYEQYQYITEKTSYFDTPMWKTTDFETAYLASLQTVFCKKEFIELLKPELMYKPLLVAFYYDRRDHYDNTNFIETGLKKIKYISLDGIGFISAINNIENGRGLIVSKTQVANILEIDKELVTKEIADDFMENYQMSCYDASYYYHFEKTLYGMRGFGIIGIAEELDEEFGVAMYYDYDWEFDLKFHNSSFRQIYLSLSSDWSQNNKILRNFIMQIHDDSFYEQHPGYYFEGYTDFTAHGILIYDAERYLEQVQELAKTIMIILIIASGLGILLFTFLTVKKYGYKIGVLKSLGAKNSDIVLIFGLQLITLSFLAFLLSIAPSFILMNSINQTFVTQINSSLVFFFINPANFIYLLVGSLIAVVISSLIPLLKLVFSSPMTVIRNHNQK